MERDKTRKGPTHTTHPIPPAYAFSFDPIITMRVTTTTNERNKIFPIFCYYNSLSSSLLMLFRLGLLLVLWFPYCVTSFSFINRRDWILTTTSSTSVVVGVVPSLTMSSSLSSLPSSSPNSSSPETNCIRWGIIGLGDVCQKKSGPAFYKCNGSRLVAVMRRTPGKAEEYAKSVPGNSNSGSGSTCVGYDTITNFLNHPTGLDAVYVSARPGTHVEICLQIATAGIPCYIEKPVGRCSDETQVIIKAFEDANVPFYTAYISRAYDRTNFLQQLLYTQQILGPRIDHVTYHLIGTGGARDMTTMTTNTTTKNDNYVLPWRLQPIQSGGGLIMDVGCHIVDRLEYLCHGPLIDIQGRAMNQHSPQQTVEDFVTFRARIGETLPPPPPPTTTTPVSLSSTESTGTTTTTTTRKRKRNTLTEGTLVECTWDFSLQDDTKDGGAKDELVFTGPKGSLTMAGMSPAGPIKFHDPQGKLIQEYSNFVMPEHTAQAMIQAVTNDLLVRLGRRRHGQPVAEEEEEGNNNNDSQCDVLSCGDNALRTQQVLDTCLESYYGGREIGYWNRPESWPGNPQNTGTTQQQTTTDHVV